MENYSSIGINGLGRIGRLVLRRMIEEEGKTGLIVKAVNASYPAETIAHLLKYDSTHGKTTADVKAEDGRLIVNGRVIEITNERDPERIPWGKLGVATVIESTGKFNDAEGSGKHIKAGAKKVIVTAPAKNMDITVVIGVNEDQYDPANHHLISTASCTTNCVAPVLHTLDKAYGIKDGWVTTVHAFTNDQNHLDNPHKDLRRARACTQSIVPTSTGIGKALKEVIPHLSQCVQGLSLRVPVADVSIADMTLTLSREADLEEIKATLRAGNRAILDVTEEPLVSVDFIGDSRSSVVDGLSLASSGNQLKLLSWYDNEWGYSCRVVDMAQLVATKTTVKAG